MAFAVGVATRGDEPDTGLLTTTGNFVSERGIPLLVGLTMGSVGCDWSCVGWDDGDWAGLACGEDGLTVGNFPGEGVVTFVAAPFGFGNAGDDGGVAFVVFGAATDDDDLLASTALVGGCPVVALRCGKCSFGQCKPVWLWSLMYAPHFGQKSYVPREVAPHALQCINLSQGSKSLESV